MGTFRVPLEVGDAQGGRWERVDALVDTGASYTVLPGSILDRLGVARARRWPFELADGRSVECDIGHAMVRYDGESVPTIVVFGLEDAEPLMGAYALEGLRLAPDPVRRRLIPVPGLLMISAPWLGRRAGAVAERGGDSAGSARPINHRLSAKRPGRSNLRITAVSSRRALVPNLVTVFLRGP